MAEYNGSALTREQWDEMEERSKADPTFLLVWEDYKKLHRGAVKRAIKTFDSYLTFTDAALDYICGDDAHSISDDKDFLEVGDDSPQAVLRFKVARFLKDKDDKTAERISVMLKNYGSHLAERDKLLNNLGEDDQAEVKQASRHAELAKRNEALLKS